MLDRAWRWLADHPRHRIGARVLQACLGAFLVARAALTWDHAPLLWGPSGWAPSKGELSGPPEMLAQLFSSDIRVYAALALQAGAGILLVLGRGTRVATLAALLPFWLLINRLSEACDAGDFLARLMLVYALLLAPPGKPCGPLRTWLHNLGVVLVCAQTCIVYASAALLKASGEPWISGTATFLASQSEVFVAPSVGALLEVPAVATLSAYGVLLLQAWYPVAINSPLRTLWLALTLMFHVWTALGMGLAGFGTVMVAVNLFLVTDAEYAALRTAVAHQWIRFHNWFSVSNRLASARRRESDPL